MLKTVKPQTQVQLQSLCAAVSYRNVILFGDSVESISKILNLVPGLVSYLS